MKLRQSRYLFLFLILFVCTASAIGQRSHCGYTKNVYLNPYRIAILATAGALEKNAEGIYVYVSHPPLLVQKPVTCEFSFGPKGEIVRLRVLKSSGLEAVDQSAMSHIRKAAPFKLDPDDKGPQLARFEGADVIVKGVGAD